MAAAIAMPNGKMRIPDRAFSPTEAESNGSGAPRLALLHRFAGEPQFLEGQLRSMAAFNTLPMYREASFARRSGVGDGLRRELRHAGLCTKPFLGCVFPHRFFLIARLSIQQPDGTGMLEETMTSPTFFRLAATLDQLPSFRGMDLWGRFVRWAFWGQHAQQSYY
jgi:hypothetical protein